MSEKRYTLGLDFGTESARALLVEVDTGLEVATAVRAYRHGVIDEALPAPLSRKLPADWALQHPSDYLSALRGAVRRVLKESGVAAADIIGIGVDFTSATILPVYPDGRPPSA